MAYYLAQRPVINSTSARLEFTSITVGANVGDYFEIQVASQSDSQWDNNNRLFGNSTTYSHVVAFFSTYIRVRPNGANLDYTVTRPALGNIYTVRVERVSTNNYECWVDGVSLGTKFSPNTFTFDRLLCFIDSDIKQTFIGDFYYAEICNNGTGVANYRWDASASGGTGFVLPETISSNDASLAGTSWPGDDSQWVFYSTGQTITGTSTHQASTATHLATGKSTAYFTLAGAFAPNQTITLSLFNSPATPSEIRLIDSNSNLITRSLSAIGGNQYTFTLPAIPAAGNNSAGVLFGSISAELVL